MTYANRGMAFENLINLANEFYKRNNIAIIDKIATPMKVIRRSKGNYRSEIVSAFFEKKSTVDYGGMILGGRSLAFEAKSTQNKTLFRIDMLEQHQKEFLLRQSEMGGIAFVLVDFALLNEVYRISFSQIQSFEKDGKKSIPMIYFRNFCHKCTSHQGNPLHYLQSLY
jgi:recombination protein U